MSRVSKAKEYIRTQPEATPALPSLFFFHPIDGARHLIELFIVASQQGNTFQELYDTVKELLLPPSLSYEAYKKEVDVTLEQFLELSQTPLKPIHILYHYLVFQLGDNIENEGLFTQAWEGVKDFVNSNLAEFGFLRRVESIRLDTVKEFKKEYDEELDEFIKSVREEDKEIEEVGRIVEIAPVEETVVKRFLVYKRIGEEDPIELFNKAKVSHTVPYVTLSPYTKIKENTVTYKEWNAKSDTSLIGYVRTAPQENVQSYSQFEATDDRLIIEWRQKEEDIKQGGMAVIEKIQQYIHVRVDENPISEEVSVQAFFKGVDINLPIFKHFIMTDAMFRKFFFLDESVLLERKKEIITLYYYDNQDSSPIVLTLNNRKADEKPTLNLPSGVCHTRVYIRRCPIEKLDDVLRIVSRCVSRFQSKQQKLETELQKIDKKVSEDYKKSCVSKKEPKQLGYDDVINIGLEKRKLSHKPQLVASIDFDKYYVVNPQDIDEEVKQGDVSKKSQALMFPAKRDREVLAPYYYKCDDYKKESYVGVSRVNITDDYKLGVVPNCFSTDQTSSQGSLLNTYLKGGDVQESESKSSYTISTSRILRPGQVGSMMNQVDKWLGLIDLERQMYRVGVFHYFDSGNSLYIPKEYQHASILFLLMYIRGDRDMKKMRGQIPTLKENMIRMIRRQNFYRTETFSYQEEELVEILNQNRFIDPRLFFSVLTDLFSVGLSLFTKSEPLNRYEFYPCPPYYYTPMMDGSTYENTIYVAINPGGEFDGIDIPICEVAVLSAGKSAIKSAPLYYPTNGVLDKEYRKAIRLMTGAMYRTHGFDNVAPTHQTLDTFGRVQWLHFDGVVAKLIDPVHSLDLPLVPLGVFMNKEQDVKTLLQRENNFESSYKLDKLGRKVAIVVVFSSGYRYEFPLEVKKDTRYEKYQHYEKVARYLTEYACLAFSLSGLSNVEEFARNQGQYFVVDQTHEYPLAERKWIKRDPMYLDSQNRLYVKSQKMITKLLYLVRQRYRMSKTELMSYRLLTYMPNYYVSLSDFDTQASVLLFDRELVERRPMEEGSIVIKEEAVETYILYKNIPEFEHDRWVCQPAKSLEHAIWIAEQWRSTQSNPLDKDGRLMTDHVRVVWTSESSYYLEGNLSGAERLVSVIYLGGDEVVYQALLPYRLE